ncbi:transporter [Flavobacterium luteum]|uniref:Transporter n=1 Tax=Flavobacterium luteum TaxID=2026654 RepID=A0A7J5AKT9_9FLAO|nr:transporter [Flavobacterium luteum]KAB1158133.1 transporter [Flavobacterium luteum]
MTKIILLFVVAIFATTQAYSQCACCAGSGTGSSNGDYNNGILTLQKKQWVVETYGDYRTVKEGAGHHGNHEPADTTEEETPLKSMFISSLGLRYGITDKITVSALLPYVFLQTDNGNDNGIGDLILLGTFNIFSKNNFNVALQAGVELPTGIQKGSNFDNTTVVVGSGSLDQMAGLAFSKRWDKLTLQGNGLFKYTTTGFEDNYYGSISIQNLSLSYRIKGDNNFCSPDISIQTGKPNFGWNVFGGYYGEWLDKITEKDVVDENSGYYLGFATLGTNISYKKWSFPLTVSLPVIQHMNGEQNDAGFRLRLGIIKSF